jgi:hypothetical protein
MDKSHQSSLQLAGDLSFLLGREEFQRFIERHQATVDEIGRAILSDDMPAEGREALRQRRLGILMVIGTVEEDLQAAQRMLG